jgi:hypothetical protein
MGKGQRSKAGDLVLWLDRKTRRARCIKLNRLWTGPWRIIKQMGEVVYRIKYERSEKVIVKRRVVHHNQLKLFHDVREPDTADNNTVDPEENDSNSPETDDAVVVIEGPDVAAPIEDVEQDNNNPAEQPKPTNDMRDRS